MNDTIELTETSMDNMVSYIGYLDSKSPVVYTLGTRLQFQEKNLNIPNDFILAIEPSEDGIMITTKSCAVYAKNDNYMTINHVLKASVAKPHIVSTTKALLDQYAEATSTTDTARYELNIDNAIISILNKIIDNGRLFRFANLHDTTIDSDFDDYGNKGHLTSKLVTEKDHAQISPEVSTDATFNISLNGNVTGNDDEQIRLIGNLTAITQYNPNTRTYEIKEIINVNISDIDRN